MNWRPPRKRAQIWGHVSLAHFVASTVLLSGSKAALPI